MPLSRHTFRWVNGVGIALTFFFALWLLIFVLALVQDRFEDLSSPMPVAFALVGALSLVAMVALLAIVLGGLLWGGLDLNDTRARYLLFGWTCAGGLFFLSQALALLRYGARSFAQIPEWLSTAYWYFSVVGAATFLVLLWVNSEGHHYPWEEAEDEYDDEYDVEAEAWREADETQ